MRDVSKSSFTILGAGRSGIAAARLLKKNGAKVFLSDETDQSKLRYFNSGELKRYGIEFELGKHSEKVFENEIIIKSPGIFPDNEVLLKAAGLKKKIYSEIEAAFWFCRVPVIAITGTNGKTTTTVLTGEIFKAAGIDAKVCGNVGLAFSEVIETLNSNSVVILEVSSFQLNNTEEFKPDVAVMLNVTPDHIDWHKNFENYFNAKKEIFKNQGKVNLTVVNYDDELLREAAGSSNAAKSFFSIKENLESKKITTGCYIDKGKIIYFNKEKKIREEIMNAGEIRIRGKHNLYNSLASVISARAFEIKKEIISGTLMKFPGVEHRIEFVRELNGAFFFNDSKATNLDSLTVALESFDGNLILILGGREKGNDYSTVDKLIKEKVKLIIAIGETKEKIYGHFKNEIKVIKADSMEDAVSQAAGNASVGDSILLSPACKSFDMFENFEQRGKEFKRAVNNLK